jgi:serine protease Do
MTAFSNPISTKWRALLFAALLVGNVALAAEKKAEPSPAPASEPKTQAEVEKSVETLAASTRASIVVINQFDRNGDEAGVGAGFVVRKDGLIATCLHVIGEARAIRVRLADGRKVEVEEVRAWDRDLDLAVIRVAATNLTALPLGDSDELKQGASVVAVGNPMGLEYSIVQGVVSARREVDEKEMLQLAIPIEPGNSGGPLLDMEGRVQGLLNMKSAVTRNLGFAIPVNTLKPLLEKPNPVPMNRWLTLGALNPHEWETLLGAHWSRKGGRIVVEEPGTGFGGRSLCLSKMPVPPRPYEVTVAVKLDDEAGAAGLVFGSDGGDKHYGFYPSGGNLRLTRFDGPSVFTWTILEQIQTPHYRPGDWNTLKVRLEKDKILGYVNGHLVVESADHGLPEGRVGLAKFRQTRAEFKNFRVASRVNPEEDDSASGLADRIRREIRDYTGEPDAALSRLLQTNSALSRVVLNDRARQLEDQAVQLRRLARQVHTQAVATELSRVLDRPEEQIDLFQAGLLIARLDNPDLDVAFYQEQLQEMAAEISGRLKKNASDSERLEALIQYLFKENGFHGSRNDYYNRANSYLNRVLDDREGIPITLSVVFMELARKIGLKSVVGVPLPGHFMVKHLGPDKQDDLIDVFDGGKSVTPEEARRIVFETADVPLRPEHLAAASKRDIVLRMLRNLLGVAGQNEKSEDALRYLDVIVALSPDSVPDHFQRAGLRMRTGDLAGAKADFKWLLDRQPDGIDLDWVAEIYHTLNRQP